MATGYVRIIRIPSIRPRPSAYDLPRDTRVTLTVYDLLGRAVVTLVDESKPAGAHAVTWNGRNTAGRPVASGIYIYRLTAGPGFTQSRKMLLLR